MPDETASQALLRRSLELSDQVEDVLAGADPLGDQARELARDLRAHLATSPRFPRFRFVEKDLSADGADQVEDALAGNVDREPARNLRRWRFAGLALLFALAIGLASVEAWLALHAPDLTGEAIDFVAPGVRS